MGYNSSFFNGVEYDAGAVNNRFAALFSDGILVDGHIIGNALAVTLKTGMTLTVAPGRCQIYGALLEVTGSGEDLVVSAADSDNPRIDTVVVEYNLDTDINTARVAIVQGTPAASPEAPILSDTATLYQKPLADVLIPAGALTAGAITDRRAEFGLACVRTTISSNPNLLINGGFAVWQRGESFTVGTSRIYTADRWYCVKLAGGAESATVSRTEDGMLVSGATVSIAYMLEPQDVAMLAGKQLTLSIGVKNSDGSMKYITRPVEVTSAMVSLGGFTAGQTVCWVKLEIGEEATPFVPRSYGEELLACMRYYQNTETVFCPGYITVGGASFTYMPPVPMRSVPTIGGNVNDMTVRPVDSDVIYRQTVGISSSQSSGDTLYLTTTAPGVTSNRPCVVQFWGLTLDAEVYS
jgi:hypothetical protein